MHRVFRRLVIKISLMIFFFGLLLTHSASRKANPVYANPSQVHLLRTPNGGIQPQAVIDDEGVLHLIYYLGDPAAGDIFYVRRDSGKETFSAPVQVNSQPGSAVAIGTIRGAQLSVGKNGRVHVAWNGSKHAAMSGPDHEAPMLYTRMNDAKTAFEPQRNVMQFSGGLDGGGSVAADQDGNVYVVWHGSGRIKGEAHRRVWIARSINEGKTFARERPAFAEETGACGCCGLRALVDRKGQVQILYRAATEELNRDMFWLTSSDKSTTFRGARLDRWEVRTCPMSSAAITNGVKETLLAWETKGQVYYQPIPMSSKNVAKPIAAPGNTETRKHPAIATNRGGETILIWTVGTGWQKGGSLAWQVFNKDGKPTAEKGELPGVPVWGLATVVAERDGRFTVIY